MSNKKDVAVIPKGTKVQIMGCSYTLLEDTMVDGNQSDVDYILKEQEDFYKGVGVVGKLHPPGAPAGKSGEQSSAKKIKSSDWMA